MIKLNCRIFKLSVRTRKKNLLYSEIIKLSGGLIFSINLVNFKLSIDSSYSIQAIHRKIQNSQYYPNFIPFPSVLLPKTRTFAPKSSVYSKLSSKYILTFLAKKKLISTEELDNTTLSIIKKEIEEYW